MPSFLISPENLENTPSRRVGISNEVETNNRLFSCELITQAGIMLELSRASVSTAQVILHRFYCRKSMKDFKCLIVAMTSIFLAAKVEECPRTARHIILVFDRLVKKRSGLPASSMDPLGRRYHDWKDSMLQTELAVLKALGYICYVDHPHKFFLQYINALDGSKLLAQKAWNFLNDAMRSTLILRFRPEIVASGAIFLAARILQIKLPDSPAWYTLFRSSFESVEEVASCIAELYTRPPLRYIPVDENDSRSSPLIVTPPSCSTSSSSNEALVPSSSSSSVASTSDSSLPLKAAAIAMSPLTPFPTPIASPPTRPLGAPASSNASATPPLSTLVALEPMKTPDKDLASLPAEAEKEKDEKNREIDRRQQLSRDRDRDRRGGGTGGDVERERSRSRGRDNRERRQETGDTRDRGREREKEQRLGERAFTDRRIDSDRNRLDRDRDRDRQRERDRGGGRYDKDGDRGRHDKSGRGRGGGRDSKNNRYNVRS